MTTSALETDELNAVGPFDLSWGVAVAHQRLAR